MIAAVVLAAVAGFGACWLLDRHRLRSYREVTGWQGDEIVARKLADQREDPYHVRIRGPYDYEREGGL